MHASRTLSWMEMEWSRTTSSSPLRGAAASSSPRRAGRRRPTRRRRKRPRPCPCPRPRSASAKFKLYEDGGNPLRTAFDNWDVSKSGKLTVDELLEGLKGLGLP